MHTETDATDQGGWVLLEDRGVLALEGPETTSFLQGLISNDLERLSEDRALYAALLTPQGKFLFELILYRSGDRVLVDTEGERLADLIQRLTLYRLRAKVEIADLSGRLAVAGLLGGDLPERLGLDAEPGAARLLDDGGIVALDPRLVELGGRALLPRDGFADRLEAEFGLQRRTRAAYERRRLELGVPDASRDLVLERATLLESGFDELHGVDFKKGCFVGQELTARMKYRGLVRKRLMPVRIEGPAPAPGTQIRFGAKDAGEMRTSSGERGLALLRLEQASAALAAGEPLIAGEARLFPEIPHWANFSLTRD